MKTTDANAVLAYRPLHAADAAAAHRLTQSIHWSHRLIDWQALLRNGTGVAALAGDEIVGVAMYWLHDDTHASLGMVITAPDYQGQGIDREMVERVMPALAGRSVLVNAFADSRSMYEDLGFVLVGRVERHQGAVFEAQPIALAPGQRVRPMSVGEGPALAALCARAAGISRGHALENLRPARDCVVLERDGVAQGFALCRRVGGAHVIGPVVAPDIDSAKLLINHWMATHLDVYLRIDVVGCPPLDTWINARGLLPAITFLSMVRGEAPQGDATMRLFTLVNLALG
ncbi:GNAT family N-acetyltransferase [Pigmentiphaga aceris]|uniref:GNAT family N-acetyltransferase n=1 Tax=Pigmentiphaga aceris TaxID=1940612 RepID=UPI001651B6D9|nr:GNAT family N-acetyltransferase [Pigmentiphaga aceris]